MSPGAALLMSIATLLSLPGLLHAASAAAATNRIRCLFAFRISETRARVAFRTDQAVLLKLEGLKLRPRLPLTSKEEFAADGIRAGLRVRSGHRSRFVEFEAVEADD